MDGGGDAVSGYEQAYASTAVHTKHIAAMTREERRKIIEDYQVDDRQMGGPRWHTDDGDRTPLTPLTKLDCCQLRLPTTSIPEMQPSLATLTGLLRTASASALFSFKACRKHLTVLGSA